MQKLNSISSVLHIEEVKAFLADAMYHLWGCSGWNLYDTEPW
jgi:hypothetical protein